MKIPCILIITTQQKLIHDNDLAMRIEQVTRTFEKIDIVDILPALLKQNCPPLTSIEIEILEPQGQSRQSRPVPRQRKGNLLMIRSNPCCRVPGKNEPLQSRTKPQTNIEQTARRGKMLPKQLRCLLLRDRSGCLPVLEKTVMQIIRAPLLQLQQTRIDIQRKGKGIRRRRRSIRPEAHLQPISQ